MKITSAYANKMLRNLEDDKQFWIKKEQSSNTYVAAINEEPVVPEYDYEAVTATIEEIDKKIATIKHSINLANATAAVKVGSREMSIDTILIRTAQLNKRKAALDIMRKQLPRERERSRGFGAHNLTPEYRYINYNLEQVKQDYESVSREIMEMQMALDFYNQTVTFDVEI